MKPDLASGCLKSFYPLRLSNNSKTEEKEGQIGLQIQKEAIFLVPKAIARQPRESLKTGLVFVSRNAGTCELYSILINFYPLSKTRASVL